MKTNGRNLASVIFYATMTLRMYPDEYTIWLELAEKDRKPFSYHIERLAQKFDTSAFEPHLTLLGGIPITLGDIESKMLKLSTFVKLPLSLSLMQMELGNVFHQALYVSVEPTENLLQANKEARKIFSLEKSFRPHISLLYSNLPLEKRQKILEELQADNNLPSLVTAEKITLWHAKGPADNWKKILSYPE